MKICFVFYPGKATQVVPLVAATEEEDEGDEEDEEDEDEDDDNDNVKALVDDHDKNNNNNDKNNNNYDHDHEVISKEPAPSNDMNSYEASWQECRLKWCLRSRSKERHDAVAGWTEDDEDDRGEGSGGSRGRTQVVRRNPSEKRQACSSDSTGSSQEEQDAAAWAAASARRPKAKPLSRVQSVRHDTAAHRYRTRQRVAAEILDEQRAEASAAAARELCRSSAAKIKKSLSFRNPAPKKVATGGDRLLRVVSDEDHFNHHHHNNNNNDNRQPRRHHDKDKDHCHHHDDGDDQQQYHQQQQLLTLDAGASFVTVATATETTVSPSTANATAGDSGSSGQDNFAIPRPKLIVPVHTYGLRKRRTGNTISSNRTASDVNAASTSSTVASSSGSSSTTTATSSDTKKHHNSCPGKKYHLYSYFIRFYL